MGDAVVLGLASMMGAGVFVALGPATQAAGSGSLLGLAIGGIVAYCNATSSAQLAAVYPQAGGTYVYGRARLGRAWGFTAGWGFVVGKTASLAAMALTFGSYVWPAGARPLAIALLAAATAINLLGIRRTAFASRILVAVVLASLAVAVIACLAGGTASADRLGSLTAGGVIGILRSAGFLFFAFAGYARIATLGEEVVQPERTIPRAIPTALVIVLGVYASVAVAALLAVGPDALARSQAPLATAVSAGSLHAATPIVRVGAVVAVAGVLLSLLAGVSRTTFSMARDAELPTALAAVDERRGTPARAEIAVALIVAAVVLVADVRDAIGFSSFAVLCYYAIANLAAWTQPPEHRRWPRSLQVLGVFGCALLAVTLPLASVLLGTGMLGLGLAGHAIRRAAERRSR
jgi:APA family basic amino acid/polyamine antiporter